MLYGFLKALMGKSEKEAKVKNQGKKKLSQKEKGDTEYKLWEMAEEYKEEE